MLQVTSHSLKMAASFKDIVLDISGQTGTIKVTQAAQLCIYKSLMLMQLNRPSSLNAFGGNLMPEVIAAIRILNEHPTTVFTVLTGEGRFFSAGADVRSSGLQVSAEHTNVAEKKISYLTRFAPGKMSRLK